MWSHFDLVIKLVIAFVAITLTPLVFLRLRRLQRSFLRAKEEERARFEQTWQARRQDDLPLTPELEQALKGFRLTVEQRARLTPEQEQRLLDEQERVLRYQSHILAMSHETTLSIIKNIDGGKAPVRFRAGAPREASPNAEVSVRFAAYPPAEEPEISALLAGVAEGASARPEMSETSWALGTVARVVCYGDHLVASPEAQTFTWEGRRIMLDFDVVVSATAPLDTPVRLKFDVSVDGIVVARLRFGIHVAPPTASAGQRQEVSVDAARTAFASYASPDRLRVLDRVASVQTATGLRVWLDCVDLRPNDHWQDLLGVEIAKRDLFFLFWSSSAAQSAWVDWEWRNALATKGLDAMQLHPLENLTDQLPAELNALHATDALMDIREAAARRLSLRQNP